MSVELPQGWLDRSISVFQSPTFADTRLGVTATREPLKGTLEAFVENDLTVLGRQLNRFEIIAQGPVAVGSAAGIEAKVSWDHESGSIYQHFIYLRARGRCLKLTVTGVKSLQKECEAVAERLLRTARIREA
jgi:hypothetical protein